MSQANRKPGQTRQIKKKCSIHNPPKGQRSIEPGFLLFQNPQFIYCVIGIVIIILLSHWPVLSAKALSIDDDQYLIKNELVQHPGWLSTGRFFSEVLQPSSVRGYYHPLSMVSLMLDCVIGGKINDASVFNFSVFHGTSLILHIVNVILIMTMIYLLFGNVWVAAGISLLFGIHPLTVEPITWIAERKTLLAAFFTLWSLVFYIFYVRQSKSNLKFYWASLFSCLLALLSKPTSTALPLILLVLDFWPFQRLKPKAFIEKIPFIILGIASGLLTYISQSNTARIAIYSLRQFLLILCHNIVFYLSKAFWPVNLSSYYAFPKPLDLSHPDVLVGVIGTCLLILLILLSLRWTKAFFAGSLFFLLAIFPTMSGIGFNNVIAADKYVYLPLVGLLLFLGWFLTWLWGGMSRFHKLLTVKAGLLIFLVLISLAEIMATRKYLVYWQDSETLMRYNIDRAPQFPFLQNQFGLVLSGQGKYEEAIAHYLEAVKLQPNFGEAYNNLGVAQLHLKRFDEALASFTEAVRIQPYLNKTYNNIGNILAYQGKNDEALRMYGKSLEIDPLYANTHKHLGKVLMAQGRFKEAINEFREALRINPYLEEVREYLNQLEPE